jgi:hypothetical protein
VLAVQKSECWRNIPRCQFFFFNSLTASDIVAVFYKFLFFNSFTTKSAARAVSAI